jgi:tetratricopeptide (TPR) repeat protein
VDFRFRGLGVKKYTKKELQEIVWGETPTQYAERLAQWMRNPSSQPEIEYMHREGIFVPRPRSQWEIDADKYIPMIDRALALEKRGKPGEALKVYLRILSRFQPSGTAYYERPAILLDRAGRTTEAIAVTRMALDNPQLSRSHDDFRKRLARLVKKYAKQYAKEHPKKS